MPDDSKPTAYTRTRDEIVKETSEQLVAMRELMIAFEGGGHWAGKLLATIIHMICHDGWGKSKSIITQLGYRSWFTVITTADKLDPNAFVQSPPTLAFGGNGWVPKLVQGREHFHKIPFEEWWAEPVFVHNQKPLTRKDLILEIRFRDGGGHVDASIDSPEYMTLKKDGGWEARDENWEKLPAQPLHLLITYTIAWELYNSFVEVSGQPQPRRVEGA
ncbi:hypothetical protein ACSMXM_16120 [Pacificimonas sp. ICDLI1SI03]